MTNADFLDLASLNSHHLYRAEERVRARLHGHQPPSDEFLTDDINRQHRAFARAYVRQLCASQRKAVLEDFVYRQLEARTLDVVRNAKTREAKNRKRWD